MEWSQAMHHPLPWNCRPTRSHPRWSTNLLRQWWKRTDRRQWSRPAHSCQSLLIEWTPFHMHPRSCTSWRWSVRCQKQSTQQVLTRADWTRTACWGSAELWLYRCCWCSRTRIANEKINIRAMVNGMQVCYFRLSNRTDTNQSGFSLPKTVVKPRKHGGSIHDMHAIDWTTLLRWTVDWSSWTAKIWGKYGGNFVS